MATILRAPLSMAPIPALAPPPAPGVAAAVLRRTAHGTPASLRPVPVRPCPRLSHAQLAAVPPRPLAPSPTHSDTCCRCSDGASLPSSPPWRPCAAADPSAAAAVAAAAEIFGFNADRARAGAAASWASGGAGVARAASHAGRMESAKRRRVGRELGGARTAAAGTGPRRVLSAWLSIVEYALWRSRAHVCRRGQREAACHAAKRGGGTRARVGSAPWTVPPRARHLRTPPPDLRMRVTQNAQRDGGRRNTAAPRRVARAAAACRARSSRGTDDPRAVDVTRKRTSRTERRGSDVELKRAPRAAALR
eukprot:353783-Chlamydomonas_euryale.AAC.12